jgi:hypothetical protein
MTTFNVYGYRLMRAAVLDRGLYEEVEADRAAITQAMATVVLSSAAAGIGAGGAHGIRLGTFALFGAAALASWLLWAALILQVGAKLMPEQQTKTSLASCCARSDSPQHQVCSRYLRPSRAR